MPSKEYKYDVVIIGSGMGGLSCAMILAKNGYKVCILEKEAQIGGTLQTFKRDKVKFDTGIHYIGGLEPNEPLYPYFKYLDLFKDLNLLKLDQDGFDRVTIIGDPNAYPHAQGHDNFKQQLLQYFPDEEKGIDQYINELIETCSKFRLYNLHKEVTAVSELDYMYTSAENVINQCTNNIRLRQVLSSSNLLYAGDENTPFYVHALVVNSYILSSYKIKNGGSEISRSLNYSLKDLGTKIIRNAEVIKINHNSTNAESVTLKDGRTIYGNIFISNVHPTETLKLTEWTTMRKSYTSRIMELPNTMSVFILYATLKPNTIKHKNYNQYVRRGENVWNPMHSASVDWGKDFAVFYTQSNEHPEYASALISMVYMDIKEVAQWSHTFNTTLNKCNRSAEYDEFKNRKAEILIDSMGKYIPNLKSSIQSYYTSTPLTQKDYLNTVDGGLYGISKDFRHPLKSMVNTRTKLQNLFLTGQNIIMHGVLGTCIGSVVTCGEIIGREKIIQDIKDVVKS